MAFQTLTYNGISSSAYGLVIENISSPPPPVRKYEYFDIPGADGQIIRDYGTYEDVQIEVQFNCLNSPSATASMLNAWLTGTGVLIHPDDSTRYYRVKAVHTNTRNRRRLHGDNYDSIHCVFVCEPYRYVVNPTALTPGVTGTITNNYNAAAQPFITLTGTNPMTLTFAHTNGLSTISIAATAATIDCAAKIVYNGTTPLNNKTILTGEWPLLYPGSTAFARTNVSAISINPRWREL